LRIKEQETRLTLQEHDDDDDDDNDDDDKTKYQNRSTDHSKRNNTIPGKVTTTYTEDGHKQNTKTSITISTKRTKEHRPTEEEMEGPNQLHLEDQGTGNTPNPSGT
jgi:hypothetical protein